MPSKKPKPEAPTETPTEIRTFALKSVDKAQAAFDRASDIAHGNVQMFDAAASSCKNRMAELQLKALELTQDNLNAGFEFVRNALAVKEPGELFVLQRSFAMGRIEAFRRQVAELNVFSLQAAKEVMKPVHDSVVNSLAGMTKSASA